MGKREYGDMQRNGKRLISKELKSLILMTVIPFILIVAILYPYSIGVHGATNSKHDNIYKFDGVIIGKTYGDAIPENRTAHFKGDLYVGQNTGWVICNGKVRFSGELHIKNAEFDYHIGTHYGSGSMFDYDYQKIEINGNKGEMEEGFPFYFLGFFGSIIGFLVWIVWYISKRNSDFEKILVFISLSFGILSITAIGFSYFCMAILIITIPMLIIMYRSFRKYYQSQKSWFVSLSVIIGFFILFISILSFICPNHYELGGIYYSEKAGFQSILYSVIGLLSSTVLIGFGFGKIKLKSQNP